jgi:hypothetical protein
MASHTHRDLIFLHRYHLRVDVGISDVVFLRWTCWYLEDRSIIGEYLPLKIGCAIVTVGYVIIGGLGF